MKLHVLTDQEYLSMKNYISSLEAKNKALTDEFNNKLITFNFTSDIKNVQDLTIQSNNIMFSKDVQDAFIKYLEKIVEPIKENNINVIEKYKGELYNILDDKLKNLTIDLRKSRKNTLEYVVNKIKPIIEQAVKDCMIVKKECDTKKYLKYVSSEEISKCMITISRELNTALSNIPDINKINEEDIKKINNAINNEVIADIQICDDALDFEEKEINFN